MTTLLQLNTSVFSEAGQSSQLAREFVQNWQRQHADSHVIVRDLANEPVPHLNGERFKAFLTPANERTDFQRDVTDYSDKLIDELQQADVADNDYSLDIIPEDLFYIQLVILHYIIVETSRKQNAGEDFKEKRERIIIQEDLGHAGD